MDHFGITELAKLFSKASTSTRDGSSSDSEAETPEKHSGTQNVRKSISYDPRGRDFCCLMKDLCCQDPGMIGVLGDGSGDTDGDSERYSPKEHPVVTTQPKSILADDKSIWNPRFDGLVQQGERMPDVSKDPRKTPEVSLSFQQTVKTEDVFLGIGHKTPATSSCDSMTLRIKLPDETSDATSSDFQLELKEQWIEFRSAKYVLVYPLPHKIEPWDGSAKWISEKCELVLTLKIGQREFDAFNL